MDYSKEEAIQKFQSEMDNHQQGQDRIADAIETLDIDYLQQNCQLSDKQKQLCQRMASLRSKKNPTLNQEQALFTAEDKLKTSLKATLLTAAQDSDS